MEGNVGFLRTDNRVCVALSRAKHGFYVVGNMELLCGSSNLWKQVRSQMEKQNAISDSLILKCENHPDEVTVVKKAEDIYAKSPEGGCLRACSSVIPKCGHPCPRQCHFIDKDHENIVCPKPCVKVLCSLDHICPKKCWEVCGPCNFPVPRDLPCGHNHTFSCHIDPKDYKCPTKVEKTIPDCQHTVIMECHKDPSKARCPIKCDTRLDCGHVCRYTCHVKKDPEHENYNCFAKCPRLNAGCTNNHPCSKKCYEECNKCVIPVEKTAVCGHKHKSVPCHTKEDEIDCYKPCSKVLPCGHPCKRKCNQTCGNCTHIVTKIADCGHSMKVACKINATRSLCREKCERVLECNHKCEKQCNQSCTTKDECTILVNSNFRCPKNHPIKVPCGKVSKLTEEDSWIYCTKPCNQYLDCQHPCKGNCSSCYHGRLHQSCQEPCKKTLVCGHICKAPCSKKCPPCQEMCSWKCEHSRCRKKCGDQCTSCKEACQRNCQHKSCKNVKCRCGDACSESPCDKPCPKTLQCGHPCVGYCGDRCPNKCRICNKEELTQIIFGDEDDPNARFVMLEDCGHSIEGNALKSWLDQELSEIGMRQCPLCKTPIYNNKRFQNIILETYEDVKKVKYHYFDPAKQASMLSKISELINQVESEKNNTLLKYIAPIKIKVAQVINNKRPLSLSHLDLFLFQVQGVENASKIFKYLLKVTQQDIQQNVGQKVLGLLKMIFKEENHISMQKMEEVNCEFQRLKILPSFYNVKSRSGGNESVKKHFYALQKLMDPTIKFDDQLERKVKIKLKECEKYVGGLGIPDDERKMILEAMALQQGHWYKCPNNHIYCITECGGAMIESKCPECGAKIGGTNHTLLPSNAVATEMDGARHGAWSNQANLLNYDINDL